MHEVYLLLGSNLGDRTLFLHNARVLISERVGNIIASSSLYETSAWGVEDQPSYINQVLKVLTHLAPSAVLTEVLNIEKTLGRERIEKWGSRVIDIDILFYDNAIIDELDLVVPHPYFHQRRFAVEPMIEIAPNFEHPLLKKTIKSIALELTDNLHVERF